MAPRINGMNKILLLTFKALHRKAPSYIQDVAKIVKRGRSLRTNHLLLLQVPKANSAKYIWRDVLPKQLCIFGTKCL